MRLSLIFRLVYWTAVVILAIQDLTAPTSLLFGLLTAVFHGAELYLAMHLIWYFVSLWRRHRRERHLLGPSV